jgi:transcription initiation factor TFIIF subunit beta
MAQVKTDPDSPYIKPDPDNKDTILTDLDDEDIYEDAGDLDFSLSGQNVWLSRLPRQLWEHWAHLDDDEEVEIGTVRIEGEPGDLKRVSWTPVCVGVKFSHLSYVGQLALARPPR